MAKNNPSSAFGALKQRLIKGKVYSVFIIVALVLGFTAVWGAKEFKEKNTYKAYLSNEFNRNFYVLGNYIRNINLMLGKVPIASTNREKGVLFSEIWRQSYAAQDLLGQLPINQNLMDKTSKYLRQVGDYNYMLFTNEIRGKSVTQNNINQLNKFSSYSDKLQNDLYTITNRMDNGEINFTNLAEEGSRQMAKTTSKMSGAGSFTMIEKAFSNFPKLIYDGPFSDHVVYSNPLTQMTGAPLNKDQAKVLIKQLVGGNITSVRFIDAAGTIKNQFPWKKKVYIDTKNVKVKELADVYSTVVKRKYNGKTETIYVDIGRKGHNLVNLMNMRKPGAENLNFNQAERYGSQYLKSIGYTGLIPAYYQQYDGAVVINYVYEDKSHLLYKPQINASRGVLIYPDMIKVKISLTDGEILGFDAVGYLTYHKDRGTLKPSITEDQARKNVSKAFDIKGVDLAIIPLETKQELLCYEFKGIYNKKYYIVYINANTGEEENILQIIDTGRGKLAM